MSTFSFSQFEQPTHTDKLHSDCLVIGSGAGGALTAHFLAEKGKDVLIVEEGPYIKLPESGIADTFPTLWREGGAIPVQSNTSLVFGEGSCFGGTTQINAGLIHTVPEEVLEVWRNTYQVKDLNSTTFRKFEETIARALSADNSSDVSPLGKRMRSQTEALGWKNAEVPLAEKISNGTRKKQTMQETFLKKAVDAGARVIVNCKVERIITSGTKAIEVQALWKNEVGQKKRITISFNQIFICAGALQTPLLLRRSGIKKNIGNTLQFHPTLRVTAEFDTAFNAYTHVMSSNKRIPAETYPWLLDDQPGVHCLCFCWQLGKVQTLDGTA